MQEEVLKQKEDLEAARVLLAAGCQETYEFTLLQNFRISLLCFIILKDKIVASILYTKLNYPNKL